MSSSEKPDWKVTYSPVFMESLIKMVPDPDEREALMVKIMARGDELRKNPWLGTPINAPWHEVACNWMRRQMRRVSNWVSGVR